MGAQGDGNQFHSCILHVFYAAQWPYTICPAGTTCQRQNPYYWQCAEAPFFVAPGAEAAPPATLTGTPATPGIQIAPAAGPPAEPGAVPAAVPQGGAGQPLEFSG